MESAHHLHAIIERPQIPIMPIRQTSPRRLGRQRQGLDEIGIVPKDVLADAVQQKSRRRFRRNAVFDNAIAQDVEKHIAVEVTRMELRHARLVARQRLVDVNDDMLDGQGCTRTHAPSFSVASRSHVRHQAMACR